MKYTGLFPQSTNRKYFFSGLVALFLLSMLLVSCVKPDEFPEIPEITDVRIDKISVKNFEDVLTISIDFQDGDGDLGITDENTEAHVYVIDSRTEVPDLIKIPWNLEAPGNVKAISGTLDLKVNVCCIDPETGIACSTEGDYEPTNRLTYDIIIKDRAGNFSEAFKTPVFEVTCP